MLNAFLLFFFFLIAFIVVIQMTGLIKEDNCICDLDIP